MKLAAYQAPLLPSGSMEAVELIRDRVKWCEIEGVEFLCCPEAVLGGLADDAQCPAEFTIDVESGQLQALLAPLASKSVTAIVGFTEIDNAGKLYNVAAVSSGTVLRAGETLSEDILVAEVHARGDAN